MTTETAKKMPKDKKNPDFRFESQDKLKAGVLGFEPRNAGSKTPSLTA